jgi:hypothetical protein
MPIVGSIVERKPTSSVRPVSTTSLDTGFPTVQHRSKSAFTRNREEKRNAVTRNKLSRLNHVPIVIPSVSDLLDVSSSNDANWRDQVGKENEERVARMDDTEREEEKCQILERFGANIGDVLKRARLARERQKQMEPPSPVNLTSGCCLLPIWTFLLYSFLESFG